MTLSVNVVIKLCIVIKMSRKYICHSCSKEVENVQCNICDQCYENDRFCDCSQCCGYREND